MSAFSPMSLAGIPGQKQALLQRLMDQYQQHANRAQAFAGGPSAPVAPTTGGVPMRFQHPFGGAGLTTAPQRQLNPAFTAMLGPGGYGVGLAGRETSIAPGAPISMPTVAQPFIGGVFSPPGLGVAPPHFMPILGRQ